MDMSTLIKTEHDNWKKRMMVETCGTYILMNMGNRRCILWCNEY